ncbi:MAG: DUF5996 family protein [Chloroflexota bacterium]|nr:DUF5996 family protein [Chloroflexota bacterium]
MPLHALDGWETTRDALHSAAKIISAIRNLTLPRDPNHLHLAAKVTARGLSTDILPKGGEIQLDYQDGTFRLLKDGLFVLPLAGTSQRALLQNVISWLRQNGQFAGVENADAKIAALLGEENGVKLSIGAGDVNDDSPLMFDPAIAAGYADAIDAIYGGIARFRGHIQGYMTPIVAWSHGFDLSTLWFATDKATEAYPHLNFGFSPGSAGLPRPYLYAYAHPYVDALTPPMLPAPARWHTSGWTGIVAQYDEFRTEENVSAFVETLCEAMCRALLHRLKI